ncbi:MAG: OmpA family protein [Bacteroidales bacterium]|jgi:outer membrane protein OmpA-like peptidoglycan-associated protein
MKKIIFLSVLLFINVSFVIGQLDVRTFKTKYSKAEDLIDAENFDAALPIFQELDSLNPNNSNIQFKIGLCYFNLPVNKELSIPYLKKASANVTAEFNGEYNEKKAPAHTLYFLGKIYLITYKLDDAIDCFKKFRTYLRVGTNDDLIEDTERQIEMCYNAKKIIKNPINIKIEDMGASVNTMFPEYSPVISHDQKTLIYTSRRERSTGGLKDVEGKYYEDIFISKKDTSGKWKKAQSIGSAINTPSHEASISLSKDGKQLFIYKGEINNGDIYVSKARGSTWATPIDLGTTVNTKYHETHASLSPDGKILYFVSDKPGGYGGKDIYASELNLDGKWGEAINLGPEINTKYDEDSPFILDDGVTLYFSSTGHESMGGYDIFRSKLLPDGYWTTPENIGFPINTTDNDVFYDPADDGIHAYYSSSKNEGFGEQDIYMITILKQKEKNILLIGTVNDALSFKPLDANIEITDNNKKAVIANFKADKKGMFSITLPKEINYTITATYPDYNNYTEIFDIGKDTVTTIIKNISLQKPMIAVESKTAIKAFKTEDYEIGEKIILKNVFFDFDKATLRQESVTELQNLVNLLNQLPTFVIEISGHTDNVGLAEYNKTLSKKRAEAVVDFLAEKGISKSRLTYKGYGSEQPIATNSTAEGRQQNRRTEFKILSK